MTVNFQPWQRYFQLNAENLLFIDWNSEENLDAKELSLIFASVQQFQRGEHSEGKYLLNQAKTWEDKYGHNGYSEAMISFIREEQRHAMTLSRFMEREGIPRLRGHWIDDVFRWLRRRAGLEFTISVLAIAEVISAVYYQGLKLATRSKILRQICNQILWDEAHHLQFQAAAMEMIHHQRSSWKRSFMPIFRRVLLSGTIVLVWWQHGRVLRAGGYRSGRFWKECWQEYRDMWAWAPDQVKTEEYEWV